MFIDFHQRAKVIYILKKKVPEKLDKRMGKQNLLPIPQSVELLELSVIAVGV